MIINNNTQPNFTSSYVKTSKMALSKLTDSIDPYFELKGYANMTTDKIRNAIKLNQAGIGIQDKGLVIVGKDREADEFISRMLTKANIDHKYVEDTPVTKFDGPTIDLTI